MKDIIRSLEMRIARLEKRSGRSQGIAMADQIRKELLDEVVKACRGLGI